MTWRIESFESVEGSVIVEIGVPGAAAGRRKY
jgi:hypothetical protein